MIPHRDEPTRVLMISPQYRPVVGGYERAAERLSAALAKAGLRVVVITERRERAWPAVEFIDGYELRRLSCLYCRHLHVVTSLLSFAGYLLRHGRAFDIWHVHQYGDHAALAVALGKLLHRPVVLKMTSTATMGIEKTLGSGIVGGILVFFHRRVSACIAVSEETCEEAIRFGIPADRVQHIPNGLDGRQFYPPTPDERAAARRGLGLDCERLVLYVGRLSPEKNPLGLLDAWAAVDNKVREGALLALVGDGPDLDQVQARAQTSNLVGRVHLAGRQSDVAAWYRAADVYVISSNNEGLSNSMIEALASGLPVISTEVSGIVQYIQAGDAGNVVPIGDMPALAGVIQTLLASPEERARFGVNARKVFETYFSIVTIVEQVQALYVMLYQKHQGSNVIRA